MGTVVMLNKGITLQVSPIDGAAALHLDAGTRAVLAATDDVEWLYIVNDDEHPFLVDILLVEPVSHGISAEIHERGGLQ